MGFLDFLFKREPKEKVEEPTELLPSQQIELSENGVQCNYCYEEILPHEKRKKISGKSHHRKCFKRMKKDAKKLIFG